MNQAYLGDSAFGALLFGLVVYLQGHKRRKDRRWRFDSDRALKLVKPHISEECHKALSDYFSNPTSKPILFAGNALWTGYEIEVYNKKLMGSAPV